MKPGLVVVARVVAACGLLLLTQACTTLLAPPTPEPAAESGRQDGGPGDAAARIDLIESANAAEEIKVRTSRLARQDGLGLPRADAGYYLDVQEARLRQTLPVNTALLIRENDAIVIRMPNAFVFDGDSSRLNPAAQTILHAIADILVEFRKTFVVVNGGADEIGRPGNTGSLAQQRALVVAGYLAEHGVHMAQIAVLGHREPRRPDDGGETAADRGEGPLDIRLVSIIGDA